ncbi:MAG: hypothetical protein WKG07_25725 [Hymenobacter sp.]
MATAYVPDARPAWRPKRAEAGLLTRRTAGPGQVFHVLTLIVVQEL